MRGIAKPALLIRRVRSNAMFRKFRHRIYKPWWSKSSKCQKCSCSMRWKKFAYFSVL